MTNFLRLSICPLSTSRPSPQRRKCTSRAGERNTQFADYRPTTDISVEGAEIAAAHTDNASSVYFYVPNIIASFLMAWTVGLLESLIKRILKHRKDLVMYSPGLIFLALLVLDIASHWLQMYSAFLSKKTSHKDVNDSANWLLKTYYRNKSFMGFCCIGSEVLYIALFLLAEKQPESAIKVVVNTIEQRTLFRVPFLFALLGWATKQAVNVLQMKVAAHTCVLHDMMKKSQRE